MSIFARFSISLAVFATCAWANEPPPPGARESQTYGVIMAELALARRQFLVAAREYGEVASHTDDTGLLQRATEVSAAVEQPGLASTIAERWAADAPKSTDAQRAATLAALDLDQIDRAASHGLAWIATHPKGVEAAFDDIDAALADADDAFGARQLADALAAKYSTSPAALRMQGFAALHADDAAAAVRALTAAATRSPSRELMQALLRAKVLSGGADARAALAQPHADDLDYALLLLAAQREQEAMRALVRAAQRAETRPQALRLLGQLQLQNGDLEAASASFTQLLASGHLAEDAFYYLGVITDRRGKRLQALHLYARVIAGDNMLSALIRAAEILQSSGSAQEADQLFDRLIEDTPERAAKIWVARAAMYAKAKQQKRALTTLDAAIVDYPDNVDLRYARASTYEDMNRVDDALTELRALEQLRPRDPATWNALGYTLADHRRQLADARLLIDRAYRAAPQNAAIRDSMGWVLYRQGAPAQALQHLDAAFASDGGAEVGAHLGEVMWSLGHHAEAEKVWKQAERADPGDRVLQATMARFGATP